MKVVVDTNLLVRAFLSSTGRAAQLLEAFLAGRFRIVLSPLLIAELRRVLAYPRIASRPGFRSGDANTFVDRLTLQADVVPGHYDVRGVPDDLSDNALLSAAVEARADYIVSEDAEQLLPLKQYRLVDFVINIVDCESFLRRLDEE